ncbi:regulatory protein [Streptomyces sp. 150FB]|uniref:AAA family ATPase n=1 Tax=Streptomyces sp. 150FB TaxID=1576605 RepID=UPI00058904BC|nr:AAA family ATPase [Streptomyces sp. 150FB]KIF77715.1 regulatory protein [Streptomyces sp. 150FB]
MVPGPEPSDDLPLLERDTELAAAAAAVEALCAHPPAGPSPGPAPGPATGPPPGGLLVYRGARGLGKTALLDRVGRFAAGRCPVWSARGGETLASVPFHVVRQLLCPALAACEPTDAEELLGEWYGIAGPALGVTPPGEQHPDPGAVRDGLDALVERIAEAQGPFALVVDDAHWADLESLAWLASFARRRGTLPVLVVVAHREEETAGGSGRFLRSLGEASTLLLTLRPLTPDATADLVRATLGEHSDDPFCREVWAVTGGNTRDTVELLGRVRDSELDPVEGAAHALRGLAEAAHSTGLVARLGELGPTTAGFAWAAAVLGTEISLDLAVQVTRMSRAEGARCAEQLRDAGILAGTDPMEFTDPETAQSVYRAITPAIRTAMHGIAAWAVTKSGRGAAAAARHLLEVHPDNDQNLVGQLREAAAEHLAVGAPDAARRCLERALREPPLPLTRARVLYELGCATLQISPAATVGHLRAALDTDLLDEALRVDALFHLAQALAHDDRTEEAARLAGAAAEDSAPGPARTRLRAAHFLWEGLRTVECDGPGRSRRLAAAADGLTGRDNTERVLLMLRAWDATTRGENAEEIVQIAERALVDGRFAPGAGWTDTAWGFEPPTLLGLSYVCADRVDRAESLFTECLRAFEISGRSGDHLAFAHALVGYLNRRRGRLLAAEAHLRESLHLAKRAGERRTTQRTAVCALVDTLLARGRADEAWEIAERYSFATPYTSAMVIPNASSVRGRLLLALGRTREAAAELEGAARALTTRGRHNVVLAPWALDLARAVADEDPGHAAQLVSYARDRAERSGTHTGIGMVLTAAASLQEGPAAVELLAQAVAHLEASPSAYELAHARVEYGVAARFPAEVASGLELALRCGADGVAARARKALESDSLRR